MLKRSTLQLLRFHFSFFLMPVYWFALGQVITIDIFNAIMIFVILHFLVYPSSNGYNSYMDRDTGPIGGLENPAAPEKELFYVTVFMDALAALLSILVSTHFFLAVVLFIAASRAYSYRGVRLKKYPVWGYLTVIVFQGALVFFAVFHGSSVGNTLYVPLVAMLASSLLIGAFYPLTQIYQHKADAADGVRSLSASLGYRGTFVFSAIVFSLAMIALAWYFGNNLELDRFLILQICMLPALVYFVWWMYRVFKNEAAADFKNTMRMNLVGSACTNLAFISILILEKF
jgi:1,4-dihydroxy-2-naphthoate polyprenyltransferase